MTEKELVEAMRIDLYKRVPSLDFLKLLIQFLHFPDFMNLKPLTREQINSLPQLTLKDFVLAYYYNRIDDLSVWYPLNGGTIFKRYGG